MSGPTTSAGMRDHDGVPADTQTYDLSKPILVLGSGVTVRHHRHSDAESLSKHANNPKIGQQMANSFAYPYSVDKSHEWITTCRNDSNWVAIGPTDPKAKSPVGMGQKLPTAWVIAVDDVAVGDIGFKPGKDVYVRKWEFGYWLGEEYWGKGIMTAVVKEMVKWAWETYPWIVKLQPMAYSWNVGSQRVLEKCGFELEGRFKFAIEKNGVLGDLLTYGMVREGVIATGETLVTE